MTYSPTIPNASDLISASQQPIKDNFTQANSQFGIDHIPFNNGGINGTGFHKQVTFTAPVAAAATGTKGIIHTVNGAGILNAGLPIPYYSYYNGSVSVDEPLYPDLGSTALAGVNYTGTAYAYKTGRLYYNFVKITTTGIVLNQTINFHSAYATANINLQQYAFPSLAINTVSATTLTGFTFTSSGALTLFVYSVGY